MQHPPKSAFTLVELIVVIVILGVLATIGFVSYSGYLGGARDGNRITQLKNINDSLVLYGTTKNLPLPDDYVTVTAGTTTVGYQGYAGENVLELINYISGGQDPKDDTYYTYYLTQDRKNIQLMALLEESEGLQTHNTITNPLTNPLIPQTYAADYSNRYPKVYGKKLGVLVSNATATKNTPAQEMTTTDIDLATSTIYTAYLDDTNNINSSTNTGALLTTIPNGSCNRIKQTGGSKGNGTYKINPDGSGDIEVYCDMETDGGGWMGISQDLLGTELSNLVTSSIKEANKLVEIEVVPTETGCSNHKYHAINISPNIDWSEIRFTQKFSGRTSCWRVFGLNEGVVNTNLRPFDASLDTIENQFQMGGTVGDVYDGVNTRCDGTAQNFWDKLPATSSSHATVELKKIDISTNAYLYTRATCNNSNTIWKYSNILVR